MIEAGRPQIILCMRISRRIPKPIKTQSDYVILISFPLQQWLGERVSLLRYTYTACFILIIFKQSFPCK
jgi:hypothetical protein